MKIRAVNFTAPVNGSPLIDAIRHLSSCEPQRAFFAASNIEAPAELTTTRVAGAQVLLKYVELAYRGPVCA